MNTIRGLTVKLALGAAMVVLLAGLGASTALADTVNTLYCTGDNTCFTSNSGLTSYWTLTSDINVGVSTFTYTLKVSETGESSPGYMQDFSGQYFFGGSQLTNLQWTSNPGSWVDLSASKAGNSGTCQGNTPGAFCGAVDLGGSLVAIGTSPVTFGVSGDYTGTFMPNDTWNFQAAAALNSDGSGGNVFAISQELGGENNQVPEPATLTLLGTGLVILGGKLRRRLGKK